MQNSTTLKTSACCALLGALTPLAFAPWHAWWLVTLTLAGLFTLQAHCNAKQAAWAGFYFGLGFFGVGISWVFISISRFGTHDSILAGLLTALLIAYCALYPALAGFISHNQRRAPVLCITLSWWLSEILRGKLITGFPWLILGVTQTNSPLAPLAHTFGASGLSALILWHAALLSRCILDRKNPQKWLLATGTIGLSLAIGHFSDRPKPWQHPPIQVTLIQGNIQQTDKWQPGQFQHIIDRHLALSQPHWHSDLIIWPEGAIPGLISNHAGLIKRLNQLALKHQANLMLGTLLQDPANRHFYNALIALGESSGVYTKRHLVPLGEYTPLASLLSPLAKALAIPQSLLFAGPNKQPPIIVNGIRIAPLICYEIAYTDLVRQSARQADLLVVVTDDSWFGDSIANPQHLQIARVRAIESGKPLLFSSNTGNSAFINANGKIIKLAKSNTAQALDLIID